MGPSSCVKDGLRSCVDGKTCAGRGRGATGLVPPIIQDFCLPPMKAFMVLFDEARASRAARSPGAITWPESRRGRPLLGAAVPVGGWNGSGARFGAIESMIDVNITFDTAVKGRRGGT